MKKKTWIISATCGVLFLFLLIGPVKGEIQDVNSIEYDNILYDEIKPTYKYDDKTDTTIYDQDKRFLYLKGNTILPKEENEQFEKRTTNKQYFTLPNGKEKIRIWGTDQFLKESGNYYNIEVYPVTNVEYNQILSNSISFTDYFFGFDAKADTISTSTGFASNVIQKAAATTNNGSWLGIKTRRYSSHTERSLINLVIPDATETATGTIDSISVYLYVPNFDYGLTGWTINIHEILRTDWEELQSTWNIYKTGNNWTTAGALGDGTDYDSTLIDSFTAGDMNDWDQFYIYGDEADNPLNIGWGSDVDLLMKADADTTNGSSQVWCGEDYDGTVCYATSSIYMEIIYTPDATSTPDASSTPLGATSSTPFINDLLTITGYTEHYETSTATPDWFEYHYYRVPIIGWIIFYLIFWQVIGKRLLIELLIRWRKRKK